MKRFKVKEIIDLLKADGWFLHSQNGPVTGSLSTKAKRQSDGERKAK